MDRRGFLEKLGIGAAVAGASGWLSAVHAGEAGGEGPSPRMLFFEVREAYERAQRAGRPFLVFVIPDRDVDLWERGTVLGEYLNHGSDAQLAPLALCDVATARMEELRRIEPAVGRGEPFMVLIETDGAGPKVRAARGRIPVLDAVPEEDDDSEEAFERWSRATDAREEEAFQARVEFVASLVRELVVPDEAMIWRRVSVARAYDVAGSMEMDAALSSGEVPSPELCVRAGALALQAARWDPGREDALHATLRESAVGRFVRQPLAGSYWGQAHGCGESIEDVVGPDAFGMGVCGMGMVPEKSSRFVSFLAKGERPLCRTSSARVPGAGYCVRKD